MDMKEFYEGKVFDAYKYFGAHIEEEGTRFRTFAPNAKKVTITGEFNNWTETEMVMEVYGVYSLFFKGAIAGQKYEYCIYINNGTRISHCDPYGFSMELRPAHKSIITDLSEYEFHDEKWLTDRNLNYDRPLNIYEVHMGSWLENKEDENGWYKYDELAEKLISYVKENLYTHIEVMPLSEHPFDGSWGYQNTGFFAPTSRFGTPAQLKKFVDMCHQNEIGVIMDFVPVHFALDDYALKLYDGTELYEYPHSDVGVSEWGSCNFIHSRKEVCCFLQSAANFWLTEYHFDGLRMDAISRVIYWQGDTKRGVNGCAVDFIKIMNQGLRNIQPTAMLIAEDSTSFPGITKPVSEGGLGFDYKWDLGWMNDTLDYFKKTPVERVDNYHKLTFSMMYYYNEKYLLPLSHDEVVHGKGTIVNKMYGEYEEKFIQARAFYLYMMMHPGKKLNFMGNEIGQLREWDEKREQDWDVLKYPMHDSFNKYIKSLNEIYLNHSALFKGDFEKDNFEWADCHQETRCIYSIIRKNENDKLLAIFNFSDKLQKDYRLLLKNCKNVKMILNSNWEQFNGVCDEKIKSFDMQTNEEEEYLVLEIPAYTGILFSI